MKSNAGRRKRERSEVRLKVLDAARELFASGGEDAVTLRRVGERIEYSATTIYLHFSNKEALIQEMCQEDFVAYSRVLQQVERVADPLARLRKVAAAYVDFGLLYPAHYRAMFMTPAGSKPLAEGVPAPITSTRESPSDPIYKLSPSPPGVYDFLHTAVFKAMAAGCFKPHYREVASIAQVIWSGLHGVVSLHLVRSRYTSLTWRPVQSGAEMMVECLINGLTNETASITS